MTSKNDITGDKLATKPASEAYRDNWDRVFGRGACKRGTDKLNKPSADSCCSLKDGETLDVCKLGDGEETE